MTDPKSNWQLLMMADDGSVIPFRHVRGFALTLLALIAILFLVCAVLGWQLVVEKKRHRQTMAQLVEAKQRAVKLTGELESDATAPEPAQAHSEESPLEKAELPLIQKIEPEVDTPVEPADDENRDSVAEENIQEKEEPAKSDTPLAEKPQPIIASPKTASVEKTPDASGAESLSVTPSGTKDRTAVVEEDKSVPDKPVPDKPVPDKQVSKKPPPEKPVSEKDLYESSMKKFGNGAYEEARNGFDKLIAAYPTSSRADNARFWIGECYYREKLYEKAIIEYRKVLENYPSGNKIPAALLKQGFSYIQIGKTDRARQLLNELIANHPRTDEAKIARERLKFL